MNAKTKSTVLGVFAQDIASCEDSDVLNDWHKKVSSEIAKIRKSSKQHVYRKMLRASMPEQEKWSESVFSAIFFETKFLHFVERRQLELKVIRLISNVEAHEKRKRKNLTESKANKIDRIKSAYDEEKLRPITGNQ